MRLTADLIQSSLSYINPLTERELDLRGHKIPAIENLGVARDQDCIDLTDNDIGTLSNFPLSPRLRTLLLARNRVAVIVPSLPTALPNLTTLVLSQNRLAELADLDPLGRLLHLTHLTVVDNPVASKEHYRYWILWRCRSVRFLDFQKVKDAEREHADELFGTPEAPTALASKIALARSHAATVGSGTTNGVDGPSTNRVKLNATERKRVEALIRNATSLSDIARLEKELSEGRIPGGIAEDVMEE